MEYRIHPKTGDKIGAAGIGAGPVGGAPEKDAAAAIKATDRRRKTYYEKYTQRRWGSIDSHQMLLNVSRLGMDRAAEIIEKLYRA